MKLSAGKAADRQIGAIERSPAVQVKERAAAIEKVSIDRERMQPSYHRPHTAEPKVRLLNELVPVVVIRREALQKIGAYVGLMDKEIGWLMSVERHQGEGSRGEDIFEIVDCYLFDQQVHSSTTEIDAESIGVLAHQLMTADPENGHHLVNSLKGWGHSHVQMPVSPSGQDDKQMDDFGSTVSNWMLRLIANKKGDLKIDLWDYERGLVITDLRWVAQSLIEQDFLESVASEIEQKVRSFSSSWNRSSWSRGDRGDGRSAYGSALFDESSLFPREQSGKVWTGTQFRAFRPTTPEPYKTGVFLGDKQELSASEVIDRLNEGEELFNQYGELLSDRQAMKMLGIDELEYDEEGSLILRFEEDFDEVSENAHSDGGGAVRVVQLCGLFDCDGQEYERESALLALVHGHVLQDRCRAELMPLEALAFLDLFEPEIDRAGNPLPPSPLDCAPPAIPENRKARYVRTTGLFDEDGEEVEAPEACIALDIGEPLFDAVDQELSVLQVLFKLGVDLSGGDADRSGAVRFERLDKAAT